MKYLQVAIAFGVLAAVCAVRPVLGRAQHPSSDRHISVQPSDLKWMPAPSVGSGAQIAVIEGDPKSPAPFTFRLKLPPNFRIGVHTHPVMERLTVISGTFHLGAGDTFDQKKATAYSAGAVAMMPEGMRMFAFTTAEETVIQIHGTGPWGITYLNPADDPLKK